MNRTITIQLSETDQSELEALSNEHGLSHEELISQALRTHLFSKRFRTLRDRLASTDDDTLSDEDVFNRVS